MSYASDNTNIGGLPGVDGSGSLGLGSTVSQQYGGDDSTISGAGIPGATGQGSRSDGGSNFINSGSSQGPGKAETLTSYGGGASTGGNAAFGNTSSYDDNLSKGTSNNSYSQEGSVLPSVIGGGAVGAGLGEAASRHGEASTLGTTGGNTSSYGGGNNTSSSFGDSNSGSTRVGGTAFGTGNDADSYGQQANEASNQADQAKGQAKDTLRQKADERTDSDGFTNVTGDSDNAPSGLTGRVKHNADNDDSPVVETTKQRSERDSQGRELDSYGKPYDL